MYNKYIHVSLFSYTYNLYTYNLYDNEINIFYILKYLNIYCIFIYNIRLYIKILYKS